VPMTEAMTSYSADRLGKLLHYEADSNQCWIHKIAIFTNFKNSFFLNSLKFVISEQFFNSKNAHSQSMLQIHTQMTAAVL